MPKRFEFSAEFGYPVETVHTLLTDEGYWRSRLAPGSGAAVEVRESIDRDGCPLVTVTMTQTVDPGNFPSLVRRVVHGEMRMQRIDTWRPLDEGRAAGRVEGASTGIPVVIAGDYGLSPQGSGALLVVSGTITAKIPVIGGSIEALARQMVGQMVARDRDELLRRLADAG